MSEEQVSPAGAAQDDDQSVHHELQAAAGQAHNVLAEACKPQGLYILAHNASHVQCAGTCAAKAWPQYMPASLGSHLGSAAAHASNCCIGRVLQERLACLLGQALSATLYPKHRTETTR